MAELTHPSSIALKDLESAKLTPPGLGASDVSLDDSTSTTVANVDVDVEDASKDPYE